MDCYYTAGIITKILCMIIEGTTSFKGAMRPLEETLTPTLKPVSTPLISNCAPPMKVFYIK